MCSTAPSYGLSPFNCAGCSGALDSVTGAESRVSCCMYLLGLSAPSQVGV